MLLSVNILKNIKRDLEANIIPQLEAYNEPSFGKGEVGTLHGARTDANGYKFLRILLFGKPQIKLVLCCKVTLSGPDTKFAIVSSSKKLE